MSNCFIRTINYDADLQKLASSFNCGNIYLDNFLNSNLALDYGFGKTYVWVDNKKSKIIGYYNITAGSVEVIKDNRSCKVGSAVHINEFAIDLKYQKTIYDVNQKWYMSDILLFDCINRIEYLRTHYLGLTFITLASTKDGYYLYKRNEFEELEDEMQIPLYEEKEYDCIPMYLPLDIE